MQLDARGLPISTASAKAAAAYDHLITGYLTQRADTPARLTALLEADPDFALAHCMQGYFAMMAYKQATVPAAVQAARTALSLAAGATPRERSHIAALTAWAEGELDAPSPYGNRSCAPIRMMWSPFVSPISPISGSAAPGHGQLGRARDPGLVGGHAGLCIDTRLSLLRPRGGWELSRRRAIGAPRHRARCRRSLGRTPSPM